MLTLFCAIAACGDDAEGIAPAQPDASQQTEAGVALNDSGVNSPDGTGPSQSGRDDASLGTTEDGAAADDSGAPGFTGFQPSISLQVPKDPTSSARVIGDATSSAPSCPAGQVACSGQCIGAGQTSGSCRVLTTGTGQFRTMLLTGDQLVFLTNHRQLERIGIDGSGRRVLAPVTFFTPSLSGVLDERVLLFGSDSVDPQRAYWYSLADGAQTPTFPELTGGRAPYLAGGNLVYLREQSLNVDQLVRRTLPDGADQASAVLGDVQAMATDGEWVIVSAGRPQSGGATELYVVRADGTGPSYGSASDPNTFSAPSIYHVWLGGGFAHWLLDYTRYQRLNLQTGQLEASIAMPISNIYAVASDAQASYLRHYTPEADRIYRLPHTGGDLTLVASFASGEVEDMVASNGHLYVALGYAQTLGIVDVTLP